MKLALLVPVALAAAVIGVSATAASTSPRSLSASRSTSVIPLVRIGMPGGRSTLDPGQDTAANYSTLDTLVRITGSGKVLPWLAQRISHPKPTVYVYHLRHGVKFWNGDPMTSTDVAYSLNYERNPKFPLASSFASVKSIKASGRYTVIITLKAPDASWPYSLTLVGAVFEKKFQQAHKATFGHPGTLVMGSGPWIPSNFNPTTGLELQANPHWWGGKVPIQHISVKFFTSDQSAALAMRAGQLDIDVPNDTTGFAATAGSNVRLIVSKGTFTLTFIAMNTKAAPWNDIHVRRAVAYAINRNQIAPLAGPGNTPVSTLIPPSSLDLLAPKAKVNALLRSLPQYPNNLALAKAEMAKSAYPNGFSATTDTLQSYGTLNQAIAGELKQIGINLTSNIVPLSTWLTEYYNGPKFQKPSSNFLVTASGLSSPDPGDIPRYNLGSWNIKTGGYNLANYGPPEVDALLKQGLAEQNPAARLKTYVRVLRKLATDLPYIPFASGGNAVAISNKFGMQWGAFSTDDQLSFLEITSR